MAGSQNAVGLVGHAGEYPWPEAAGENRVTVTSMRPSGVVAAGCVLAIAGCSMLTGDPDTPGVLETGVAPVDLDYDGPTYVAVVGPDLLVRNGEERRRLSPSPRSTTSSASAPALPTGGVPTTSTSRS